MGEESKRLYVGNLYPEVTQQELKRQFTKYGAVQGVEIKHKKDMDGKPIQTFAFVDMSMSDGELHQCINTLSNTKWKGYMMRIQQAKESFMSRLARERAVKEANTTKPNVGDSSYDPLSLAKTNLDTDRLNEGGHGTEGKVKARHLGGERDEKSSVNSKRSGNYQRLGKRVSSSADTTDDPARSDGTFLSSGSGGGSGRYDPLQLIRAHQETGTVPMAATVVDSAQIDRGQVSNGMVTFGDEGEVVETKGKKRKEYHSSDEESHQNNKKSEPVKKVKKVKTKEEKEQEKEKLRLRFEAREEEKRKQEQLEAEKQEKINKKKPSANSNKYYSSSDGEEDSDDDKEDGKSESKPSERNILKKFKSFSSSVWADSDEGEADSEDETENNVEHGEEKVPVKVKVKRLRKEIPNYMPRFDPDAELPGEKTETVSDDNEDNEEEVSDNDENVENDNTTMELSKPIDNNYANVIDTTKSLKDAFNNGKTFSFGFGSGSDIHKEHTADPDTRARNKSANLFRLDPDDNDTISSKTASGTVDTDFSESFGSQLKGKTSEGAESFFFGADDERVRDAMKFFFTDREDLDKVRSQFDSKRAELASIFKKKVRSKAHLLRKNIASKAVVRPKGKRRRQTKRVRKMNT